MLPEISSFGNVFRSGPHTTCIFRLVSQKRSDEYRYTVYHLYKVQDVLAVSPKECQCICSFLDTTWVSAVQATDPLTLLPRYGASLNISLGNA